MKLRGEQQKQSKPKYARLQISLNKLKTKLGIACENFFKAFEAESIFSSLQKVICKKSFINIF